jgi:hypothetical protein
VRKRHLDIHAALLYNAKLVQLPPDIARPVDITTKESGFW